MTSALESYGLIGDGESAALVGRNGSIDWLCWPRFDSDACLAALLGHAGNGHWQIAPQGAHDCVGQRYREDTLVLETDFAAPGGRVRVVDFMPLRDRHPTVVRQIVGLDGDVPVRMVFRPRFDYGSVPPWAERQETCVVGRVGPDTVVLHADVPLALDRHDALAEFVIRAGETRTMVLRFAASTEDPPPMIDAARALAETERYWRDWIGRFDKPTDWPEAVRRSLITLKALINRPTGGMVAAPTTSLPEVPGGQSNWDYRFCWLRDATFTIAALLNAGYKEEAQAWRDWILRAIAGSPENIQIMYRLDGGREMTEWTADWLDGYRWSSPVRVGNAAARQRQIDVFGELVDVQHLAERAGIARTPHSRTVEQAIVERLETVWREPGHGIWESRGEPRHYVYSKVMAWVAVDRFLRGDARIDDALRQRLVRLRAHIHETVCREGFNAGLGSFVEYFGGENIDAALLLMPAVGFLPATDPRMVGTVACIERELIEDGLVYRTRKARNSGQGAFLACSCWLADCLQMQGRERDARAAFERVLAVRSEVGLLSEEYDIRGRRLSGNFPQALTHLALVTTALGLCGPLLQRGGG